MKSTFKKILLLIFAILTFVLCSLIMVSATYVQPSNKNNVYSGNNRYVNMNGKAFGYAWTSPKTFSEINLNYTRHYIDIDQYRAAYASHNDAECRSGKQGLYSANSKWYANNYAFQSCTLDNSWYSGDAFASSNSLSGQLGYGSRYLLLSRFTLTNKKLLYEFTPVLTNGDGYEVANNIYMIIHGYSGTKSTSKSLGDNSQYTYAQIDNSSQWFNYQGRRYNGGSNYHANKTLYTQSSISSEKIAANEWDGNVTPYITIMLRAQTTSTAIGSGTDVAFINCNEQSDDWTKIKSDINKMKSNGKEYVNIGRYKYKYICYSPFTYSFQSEETTMAQLLRTGVASVDTNEFPKAERTGYKFVGWKLKSSNNTSMSGTGDVVVGMTKTSAQWLALMNNGRFYSALFGDCVFEAIYEPISYSVTYDYAKGVAGNEASTQVNYDELFQVMSPTRTGYVFSGWSITGMDSCRHEYGTDKENLKNSKLTEFQKQKAVYYRNLRSTKGTVKFTATWSAATDTLFVVNHYKQTLEKGAYTLSATQEYHGTTGATVELSKYAKTYTGFTYIGGCSSTTGKTVPGTFVTETIILSTGKRVINLYYSRNQYKVTLSKGMGISTVSGSGSYYYEESISISATIAANYQFTEWSGDYKSSKRNYSFKMPSKNITMKANATFLDQEISKYYGEDPSILIQGSDVSNMEDSKGWFNSDTIVSSMNKMTLEATDSDGDLVSFCLYAGKWLNTAVPSTAGYKLIEGSLSVPMTSATSPTKTTFGAGKTYQKGSLQYDFRKTDIVNVKAEGQKTYTLVATDSNNHVTKTVLTVKVDFTPPVLQGAADTELKTLIKGASSTASWEGVLLSNDCVNQTAKDNLSGIYKVVIYKFSNQKEVVGSISTAPWNYNFLLSTKYPKEKGIIIKAYDLAGNSISKFLYGKQEDDIKLQPFLPV